MAAAEMNLVRSLALASIYIALSACTEGSTMQQDSVPAPLLDRVLDDAQKRTGVSRSQVEILSTEKITWTDGSLGCPQPDQMYTHALVPGYRIHVRAAAQTLAYHAAATGRFVVCTTQVLENPDVR